MKQEYNSHSTPGATPESDVAADDATAFGVPLEWPADLGQRRKLFWKWCKFGKHRTEGRTLKGVVILEAGLW